MNSQSNRELLTFTAGLKSPTARRRRNQADVHMSAARRHLLERAAAEHVEPPYSPRNELRFFVKQGLPLCALSILKMGVPPVFAMVVAGNAPDSVRLQASFGFARTFYNVVTLMPLMALCSYFQAVVPGCIGADRLDRLPRYFWRSVLLTSVFILPSMVAQLFADSILAAVGVPADIVAGVGVYCRLMISTAWLTLLDNHLECCFVNLGFVHTATLNALITGLGVDVGCTYLFVGYLHWGMRGAAFAALIVRGHRRATPQPTTTPVPAAPRLHPPPCLLTGLWLSPPR